MVYCLSNNCIEQWDIRTQQCVTVVKPNIVAITSIDVEDNLLIACAKGLYAWDVRKPRNPLNTYFRSALQSRTLLCKFVNGSIENSMSQFLNGT